MLEDFAQEEGPTQFQDGQRVILAGVVSAAKTKTTQNNSLMAYVTLEDDTGSMELLVFSRVLEESGSYLQENLPILAEGRISVRDEKAPQLMCDRVTPLSQVPEPAGAAAPLSGKLYLRFARSDDPLLTRVRNLFVLFPGAADRRALSGRLQAPAGGPVPAPPRPAPGAERAAGGGKCGAPMTLRPLHKKGLPSL